MHYNEKCSYIKLHNFCTKNATTTDDLHVIHVTDTNRCDSYESTPIATSGSAVGFTLLRHDESVGSVHWVNERFAGEVVHRPGEAWDGAPFPRPASHPACHVKITRVPPPARHAPMDHQAIQAMEAHVVVSQIIGYPQNAWFVKKNMINKPP